MKIVLIASVSANGVIGNKGKIPWHFPEDLKHFKRITEKNYILMGRKTFDSIGKALPDRINIIVSKLKKDEIPNVSGLKVVENIEDGLKFASDAGQQKIYIIGGGEIFSQVIEKADELIITELDSEFEGDVYFPQINPDKWEIYGKEMYSGFNIVNYVRRA